MPEVLAPEASAEEPVEEPEVTEQPEADEEESEADETEEPAAESPAESAGEEEVEAPSSAVLLGSPELTAGIPGEGELTQDQLDVWLAEPSNHETLTPELPLGLAAGAGGIQGIDANPLTRAKIELGRQLYFDTRLSADNTVSCASCHAPEFGYAKDTQFGVGIEGQEGGRNSPVAYNRILSGAQFWDGRAESLEAQAVGPIANPIEMGNTHEACVETLNGIEGYRAQFAAIFEDGITIDNVGRAIASFERAIVSGPAPWDYYEQLSNFEKSFADDIADLEVLREEDEELYEQYMALKSASEANPISESAARGGELFFSDKAGCTACHVGANFTDEKYHNLGVGMDAEEPDLGRFAETNEEKDRGAFKTPTIRNVALTGPYMHDGTQKTLMEVVEWYAKGGHPNDHLSENIKKLELSDQDKQDLVAFMAEGLLGEFPEVETGRLPQ
ncbi:MAG: c-type cytochrome [Planctomycetales bacterium]|nr:c-type cytochrome [Planctomycetales bacterium]